MKKLLLTTILSVSLLSPLMASDDSDGNEFPASERSSKKAKSSDEDTWFGDIDLDSDLLDDFFPDWDDIVAPSAGKRPRDDQNGDVISTANLIVEDESDSKRAKAVAEEHEVRALVPLRATEAFRQAVPTFYDSNGRSYGVPRDIVKYILSFIRHKRDLAALRLVSRGFCNLVDAKPVLSFSSCGKHSFDKAFLLNLLRNKIGIKSLELLWINLADAEIHELASICKDLQVLSFLGCCQFTGAGLKAIAQSNPGLTDLGLRGNANLTDEALGTLNESVPNLRSLDLRSCPAITGNGLKMILAEQPNLVSLVLADCTGITDEALSEVLAKYSGLRKLDLSKCNVSDTGLLALDKAFPNLNDLKLSRCNQISDEGLQAIGRVFPNLTSLDVLGCTNIRGFGLQLLAERCKSLTSICLHECGITDDGVDGFAASMPSLTSINLTSSHITHVGLRRILSRCPKLVKLYLEESSEIDDEALEVIAQYGKELSYLDLNECTAVSNEGLQAVVNACPKLSLLWILGCDQIDDNSLQIIANGCPNLTGLDLGDRNEISDEGLIAIAKGCPKLEWIYLGRGRGISTAGLEALAANHKKIEIGIDTDPFLYNDIHFTDEELEDLSARYPSVRFN